MVNQVETIKQLIEEKAIPDIASAWREFFVHRHKLTQEERDLFIVSIKLLTTTIVIYVDGPSGLPKR